MKLRPRPPYRRFPSAVHLRSRLSQDRFDNRRILDSARHLVQISVDREAHVLLIHEYVGASRERPEAGGLAPRRNAELLRNLRIDVCAARSRFDQGPDRSMVGDRPAETAEKCRRHTAQFDDGLQLRPSFV